MPIDKYITHNFEGIEKVQDLVDALYSGKCLRGVLHIGKYEVPKTNPIEVVKSEKCCGGVQKTVKHWSPVMNCNMTFRIWLP